MLPVSALLPVFVSLLLLVLPASPTDGEEGASLVAPLTLFAFDAPDEASWEVTNDGVMGGLSQGFIAIEGGTLRFTGELVTRGGGFTSIRTRASVDLSGYDGVELRVRGSGRTFEVEVDDGTRRGWRRVSRQAPFETTPEWTWVRVPFSALGTSVWGQPVTAAPIDLAEVEAFGLYILDGIDGPFELEVDTMRAYRDAAD
ncbi:MAG: CIA30 family protein [Bacteroidota bacterium]